MLRVLSRSCLVISLFWAIFASMSAIMLSKSWSSCMIILCVASNL